MIRAITGRLIPTVLGLAGGFLLVISLAPVFLSGKNSTVLAEWRDIILQWTQFTGYLRLAFAVVAIVFICVGLVGIILAPFKPVSAQMFMTWGGLASLSLLLALWLGFLDLHVPIFGSTNIGSQLIWDRSWGIAKWNVAREIIHLGNGWLKPAFAGGILLVLTNLPLWWQRLR
jgi:hypothetical protein